MDRCIQENNELIPQKRSVVDINKSEKESIALITENEKFSKDNQRKDLLAIIERSGLLPFETIQSAQLYMNKNGKIIALRGQDNFKLNIAQY